eukprot:COSAG04_NODE_751_length_10585_cov_8.084970_8_plen_197_part_00
MGKFGPDDGASGWWGFGGVLPVTVTLMFWLMVWLTIVAGGLPPSSSAVVADEGAASVDSSTAVATSGLVSVSEPAGAAISCSHPPTPVLSVHPPTPLSVVRERLRLRLQQPLGRRDGAPVAAARPARPGSSLNNFPPPRPRATFPRLLATSSTTSKTSASLTQSQRPPRYDSVVCVGLHTSGRSGGPRSTWWVSRA